MMNPKPTSKKLNDAVEWSKRQGQNGKGSQTRSYDKDKFDDNFEGITSKCQHCGRKKPFGEACPHCGRR